MPSRSGCPVCASTRVEQFLRRDGVPVHQNLIMDSEESAVAISRGTLAMMVCRACGFVYNDAFDLGRLAYGSHYDNTQTHSASFAAYVDDLVAGVLAEDHMRQAVIVEVGCGKGDFLKRLVSRAAPGVTGIGFDPTYVGDDSALDGRVTFQRRFFDASCTGVSADVVICRHVIEHVPDPVGLLRSIRTAVRSGARLFFETPDVAWILRGQVFWDFFYEHCSLFTAESLRTAFEHASFTVTDTRHVFGGQYLWLEASAGQRIDSPSLAPGDVPVLAERFAEAEGARRRRWTDRVEGLRDVGGVALWGAGAKGVSFANLVDPSRELVSCVVDLNPSKQGHYLPGTGHPIVGHHALADHRIANVVLMNPNYRAENLRLLQAIGSSANLVEAE